MPTKNPRVSITLTAPDLAILDRFSAASGTPRATVLSGLVSAVLPQLVQAAELMEMASAAPRHVQESLAASVRQATENATGALTEAQGAYSDLMGKLQRELPLEKGRSRKGSAAARPAGSGRSRRGPDPRLLTGGSK